MTPERAERIRAANRDHYRRNRKRRLADAKRNYIDNREARIAQRALYRETHGDELRARGRAAYQRDRVQRLAKQKLVRATGEEKVRVHGLTLAQYHAMLAAQDDLCAICRLPMKRICIDHDHATGRVRGLLCLNCNVAIGHLRDSPDLLRAAADYIQAPAKGVAI